MRGRLSVAVTGSAGFVGRHVVAELLRRGFSVTRLQRPGASVPRAEGDARCIPVDLTQAPARGYDEIGQPDVLMHLAWGRLDDYSSLDHFEHELPRHYRWLRSLVDGGLRHLLVTGTCFEYGWRSGALDECLPSQPHNPYALAKDALHCQLRFLQALHPFGLTWARLFYLYGDGQHERSLLPQLKRAVARGDALFPMSGGEQLRDYLPVAEVARVLVELAVTAVGTESGHGAVNVCSGQPVSIRRLVEQWIAEHSWRITLDLGRYPYSTHEPLAFWGEPTKMHRCLTPI